MGTEVLKGRKPVLAIGLSPCTPGTAVEFNTGHILASFTLVFPLTGDSISLLYKSSGFSVTPIAV